MSALHQAVGALDREAANVARIGTVREVRVGQGVEAAARVDIAGLVTDWCPWVVKAGEDSDWWVPSVDEQVVVLMLHGDVSQGFIVGSIYSDKFPEPGDRATIWRKSFADGTRFTYDREAHTLEIDTKAIGGVTVICKTAHVKADESITFETPDAHFTGKVTIDDLLTAKASADVTGKVTASDDCIGGGISLKGHTHTEHDGPKTSPPG